MNAMEPNETMPHPELHLGIKTPHTLSSFVFVDLRENPEAWAEIENELPGDMSFPVH